MPRKRSKARRPIAKRKRGKKMAEIPQATIEAIMGVQDERRENILSKQNVLGFGIGFKATAGKPTERVSLVVYVTEKLPMEKIAQASRIDPMYGNIPTDVEVMEPLFAFPLTQRVRPAMGGYSVGHYGITAGTIATCVRDKYYGSAGRKFYVLSNNHVLANSNQANIGDPILQPGPYDGGKDPDDRIARLTKFVPIGFGPTGSNKVDAAIAEVDFSQCNREVFWIGHPSGWRKKADVKLATVVQKTGRTTDYTVGQVAAINATVNVGFGGGQVARFVEQIIITPGGFSAGGDSGSLITDINEVAVGLLFAGSSTHTIANYIENVLNMLYVVISENVLP